MAKSKTFPLGRNHKGRFIPVEETKKDPERTTIERIPKKGFGDTKKK